MVRIVFILAVLFSAIQVSSQEDDLSGVELAFDQDGFADFLRDSPYDEHNYAISMRVGIYGAYANSTYLGLPWVREKIDGFILDRLIYKSGFREERTSHNFVFTSTGFSPSFISDETEGFDEARALGYSLADDRPFSSFTGFRSTRRIEGSKRFAHSARLFAVAFNSSFTFGFASLGLPQGLDNLLGGRRADALLWDEDSSKPYPTGQLIKKAIPLFLYSVSTEVAVLQPLRKVLVQVRPELNLGYYTNIGLGIDIGKVMNVEKLIDNLGFTDTHNPSVIKVNDDDLSFSLVGGVTARAVFHNAHLNGFYGWSDAHHYTWAETRRFLLEGHVGVKVQFVKKIEVSFSINRRTSEFNDNVKRSPMWGTIGLKYLIAEEGEGCYN